MARQVIDVGTGPDTKDGEPLRDAFIKVNANFSDIGNFPPSATITSNFDTLTISGQYRGAGATGAPHSTAYVVVNHNEGTERGYQTALWGVTNGGNLEARFAYRIRVSGVWTDWKLVADGKFGSSAVARSSSVGIDDIQESGQYWSTSAPTLPVVGTFTSILHTQIPSSSRATQVAIWSAGSGDSFQARTASRYRNGEGVWTPWSLSSLGGYDQLWKANTPGDAHVSASVLMERHQKSKYYDLSSNAIYTSSEELDEKYMELVDEFPDYVSVEELGVDAWSNPIKQYTFEPPTILGDYGSLYPHPKICVSSGMHCGERPAIVSMLCFADDLCRNWRGDEMLTNLRWGCKLVIVPNWVPSGINPSSHAPAGHSRLNGNGVDINRNFDYQWDLQTDPRKGPSAASEIETQIIQSWPAMHPDAVVFFDQHSADAPSDSDDEYPLWFITRPLTAPIVSSIARKQHAWMKREILLEEGNVARVNVSRSGSAWMTSYYNEVLGVKAFTIEGGMPSNPSVAHLGSLGFGPLRLAYVKQMTFTLHEIWRWHSGVAGHVPIA